MGHASQLQHFELAHRRQVASLVAHVQNAVGDSEFRPRSQLVARVFADEEGRRAPAGKLNGQVIDMRATMRVLLELFGECFEAVDRDEGRLVLRGAFLELVQRASYTGAQTRPKIAKQDV